LCNIYLSRNVHKIILLIYYANNEGSQMTYFVCFSSLIQLHWATGNMIIFLQFFKIFHVDNLVKINYMHTVYLLDKHHQLDYKLCIYIWKQNINCFMYTVCYSCNIYIIIVINYNMVHIIWVPTHKINYPSFCVH